MKPSEIFAMKANVQAQEVFEQGRVAMEGGHPEQAKARFEAALAIYPQNFDALHFLGIVHAQMGLHQFAVSYFKQAAQINPNMAAVHNNLGLTLDDLQRYDEALASFDRALALVPDYAQAFANKAATQAKAEASYTK